MSLSEGQFVTAFVLLCDPDAPDASKAVAEVARCIDDCLDRANAPVERHQVLLWVAPGKEPVVVRMQQLGVCEQDGKVFRIPVIGLASETSPLEAIDDLDGPSIDLMKFQAAEDGAVELVTVGSD